MHLLLLVLGSVVAFSFGFLLVDLAGDSDLVEGADRTELELWAAFIGAVCAYAVFGGYFMVRWLLATRRLVSLDQRDDAEHTPLGVVAATSRVRRWWHAHPVVRWSLEVLGMLGVVFFGLFRVTRSMTPVSESYHEWQLNVVTAISIAAVIPGLVGLLASRSLADNDRYWNERPRCQVLLHRRLRRDTRRYLFVLGGFLTLVVITTGARRRSVLALNADANFPPEYVLLYGLVFAAILGSTYWVAEAAIGRRTEALVDKYAALPAPDIASDNLEAALDRHDRVRELFATGESTWSTLQTGVVILGPLLTGLIGSFLPEQ